LFRLIAAKIKIMLIYIIAIYLVVTFILTAIGIERYSEGLKIFITSLLLTPFVGLVLMLRQKRSSSRISYYYCKECDYIFPVKMTNCPICAEQHKKIRLTKYTSPNDVTKSIKTLNVA